MKALSVPNIVMSTVCVTIMLYEFAAWTRTRGRNKDLAFVALALGGALFNFACAGEYGVSLPEQSAPWLHMQGATLNLTALAFVWYFSEQTGKIPRRLFIVIASILGSFALTQILPLGNLDWIASIPSVLDIRLPFGIRFSYLEVEEGPLTVAATAFGFLLLAYLWWVVFRYRASGHKKEGRPLLGMLIIVCLAYTNDFAVGSGWYPFVFTVEYAWLAVVVLVGQQHTREIVDAAKAKEALQKSEKRLIASLREKDLLLKEVHHRVKNNLQIVSSMLFLQARRTENAEFRALVQDCRDQVVSMALIHEDLYRSKDLWSVDFGAYARALVERLVGFHRAERGIALRFEADSVWMSIERAIPLGLILNELCTNALKHAFPPDTDDVSPTISVTLRRNPIARITFCFEDNGVGLPADFDPEAASSFGMKIVRKLVDQLAGEFRAGPGPGRGSRFELDFPAEELPSSGRSEPTFSELAPK